MNDISNVFSNVSYSQIGSVAFMAGGALIAQNLGDRTSFPKKGASGLVKDQASAMAGVAGGYYLFKKVRKYFFNGSTVTPKSVASTSSTDL